MKTRVLAALCTPSPTPPPTSTETKGEHFGHEYNLGDLYRKTIIRYTNQFGGLELQFVLGALGK